MACQSSDGNTKAGWFKNEIVYHIFDFRGPGAGKSLKEKAAYTGGPTGIVIKEDGTAKVRTDTGHTDMPMAPSGKDNTKTATGWEKEK